MIHPPPPPATGTRPRLRGLIGLDWGDQTHAFALYDLASGQIESFTLPHSAENLHQGLDQLAARFGSRPVALALEGTRGTLFPALLDRPWLHVFAVHPATSSRYRAAFTPSGAKDDQPDARLLLELPQRHRDKLTPLSLADGSYWVYRYDALGQVLSGRRYWADGSAVAGHQFDSRFDDIGNRDTTGGRASAASDYTANRRNQYTSRTVPPYVDVLGLANPTTNVTVNGNIAMRKGEYFHYALNVPNATAQ